MSADTAAVQAPDGAAKPGGLSTKAKVFIGLGAYLAIAILLLLIFGSDGKNEDFKPQNEFKLEDWIADPHRRHRPQHQQGGPLPVPGQRPDDRGDGLDRATHAAEAEPGADRGRGRLRPGQEQHRRRQHAERGGAPLVPLRRRPLLLDPLLEPDRLPAAADQHRAHLQRLRPRDPVLRDLRGDRQPLDPAGPDAGRLDLLPRRRGPGQRPRSSTWRAGCRRASRT